MLTICIIYKPTTSFYNKPSKSNGFNLRWKNLTPVQVQSLLIWSISRKSVSKNQNLKQCIIGLLRSNSNPIPCQYNCCIVRNCCTLTVGKNNCKKPPFCHSSTAYSFHRHISWNFQEEPRSNYNILKSSCLEGASKSKMVWFSALDGVDNTVY